MLEKNWFIIVNPAAGNGKTRRLWPRIERELQAAGFSYSVRFSEKKHHAESLAVEAVGRGYRKILAVGGDGTAHEVANGILRQDFVESSEIKFALLPVGTGNDWAREWNLPQHPRDFFEILKKEKTKFQDVGHAFFTRNGEQKERFFINVAGMAYDGFVVREAEKKARSNDGFLGYYALIINCLWKFRLSPARLFFKKNDREILVENSFYTINLGCCRFSGGGMQFVPHAVPDDGFFALTYAEKMSKFTVILATPKFYNGKIAEHPKVVCEQTTEIRVETDVENPPVLLEADGEFLGESPIKIVLKKNALQLVC
jgi:diacylglycerol kinase (ATP)